MYVEFSTKKEKILKKYLEILKKCQLFDKIEEERLEVMLKCLGAKAISFDKKYTVFAEGARDLITLI